MKLLLKLSLVLLLLPVSALAQPGVRMSSDFLPLEVGNRWVYDVFNQAGQKTGTLDFAVEDYRIVNGRSFYLLSGFPFVPEGNLIRLVRYDRQERQYMRMVDNAEGPLFLADGARVEVLQADDSGLPVTFVMHGDLADLTFQRGRGITEARLNRDGGVQIAKLVAVHTSERKAVEAASQGAAPLPPPVSRKPEEKEKRLSENVAAASGDTVALDVQVKSAPEGTMFVLTVVNSTDKLVPFKFNNSQTYDFAVIDSTGREVWRWSRRMLFSDVVRQEALRPNGNWTYQVTWNHRDNDVNPVSPGAYQVIGSLASEPAMQSSPVSFQIR